MRPSYKHVSSWSNRSLLEVDTFTLSNHTNLYGTKAHQTSLLRMKETLHIPWSHSVTRYLPDCDIWTDRDFRAGEAPSALSVRVFCAQGWDARTCPGHAGFPLGIFSVRSQQIAIVGVSPWSCSSSTTRPEAVIVSLPKLPLAPAFAVILCPASSR
jgi:hypothetical protein